MGQHGVAEFAWVMVGCALGGMARYGLSAAVARRLGETFPWGIMAVNVSGALAVGVIAGAAAVGRDWMADPNAWLFAVVGFLGSYTTVSSFSLQTLALLRHGKGWQAAANIMLSLGLCLASAALGLFAGTRFLGHG